MQKRLLKKDGNKRIDNIGCDAAPAGDVKITNSVAWLIGAMMIGGIEGVGKESSLTIHAYRACISREDCHFWG